ncbi:MAG: hypothetical protein V4538_00365 [Bacteroidota bacterium]
MTEDKRYTGQISDKDVFLSIMEELRYRNRENHYREYDILKSCGIVRQLLLDGNKSLYDKVNRQHKLKTKYKIFDYKDEVLNGNFWYKSIYPYRLPYTELKLADFLELHIISENNNIYNVRELILYGANTGGVHSITFKKESKDGILQNMKGIINIEGISKFLAMQNICMVVIDALMPLEELIKKTAEDSYL